MRRRPRTAVLAVVLALAGTTPGCARLRDYDDAARGDTVTRVYRLLGVVDRTVEQNASVTDDELVDLLATAVADSSTGTFDLVGAPGRRTTWHSVVTGAADGPLKSQVLAAACFEVVVDRDAGPAVTTDDLPCPDEVVEDLQDMSSEADIVLVADLSPRPTE
ncbi:hypothetical protein [Cellulomonas xiejunii]|uniref:Lipoprotein n=1 Tax=Cellulomonas xiejunii TaxID=2968083 RepID=A0ABY5KNZ3_9CELL|nr:hypothetical protein [Cellulomonas xiejunii]MCC2320590.1 hypothetical protein [Cellulomonas xiejunii]UUI70881.1 hypothetical protein NP048_13925 [Cellulomonas xiejunii]